MPRVLITGASRGLGLEFARQYAANGWDVLAACREPAKAEELNALGKGMKLIADDATKDTSIEWLAREIGALDIVIANASDDSGRDQLVSEIAREDWTKTITVNTYSPVKLAIALRPNLERGAMKKLAAISSLAGSIGRCEIDGHYAFRASKAALNSIWRSFSVEWRPLGIVCLLLSPETTGAQFDPTESVADMRRQIAESTMAESGRFFSSDGAEVPW